MRFGVHSISNTGIWPGYHHASLILLVNTVMVCIVSGMLLPYTLIGISESLTLEVETVSAYFSIAIVSSAVLSLGISLWCRDHQLGQLGLAGYGISCAGLVGLYWALGYAGSALVFMVVGGLLVYRLGTSMTQNVDKVAHIALNGGRDAAALFSYSASAVSIGLTVGPLVGSLLYSLGGFESIVSVAIILSVFNLILFYSPYQALRSLVPQLEAKETEGPPDGIKTSLRQILRPSILLLLASSVLATFLVAQTTAYIPLTVESGFGAGFERYISAYYVINSVVLIFTPKLIQVLKKLKLSQTAELFVGLSILPTALIVLSVLQSPLGLVASSLMFSMGQAIYFVVYIEAMKSELRVSEVKNGFVIYNFLTLSIGLGIGQYIGARVDALGMQIMQTVIWISIAVLAIILAIASTNIRRAEHP